MKRLLTKGGAGRLRGAAIALLALALAAELLVELKPHFGIDAVFAFHAWYTLAACAGLLAAAKALGALFGRAEDYYGGADD